MTQEEIRLQKTEKLFMDIITASHKEDAIHDYLNKIVSRAQEGYANQRIEPWCDYPQYDGLIKPILVLEYRYSMLAGLMYAYADLFADNNHLYSSVTEQFLEFIKTRKDLNVEEG